MSRKKAKRQQFRHENGFGSIVKLSGNRRKPFAVRITTGWKDSKQVRKYLGYYTSEAEALIALAEYHKGGYDVDLAKLTLEEMFDRWYARIESKASRTVLSSHNMTKTRFGDLGKKPIREVKADHLQDWFDEIDLKPNTKNRIKSTLHQLFDYAIKNDIVDKNPAKFLTIGEKAEQVGKIFTDEEIQVLWDNADTNIHAQTVLILIYTGMRVGELLELRAENLHLDEAYAIGGSKTEAGRDRIIPFHNKILPIVKARYEKYGCIVPNKKGEPLVYRSFQRYFGNLMDEFGWSHKIHDTRKTGISLMHRAEIPIETIRIIVGHSGQGVTEKVYLKKTPEDLVKAINKL